MKSDRTDLELWQMIAQDDAAAFEELYNRYSKGLFVYALNIFKKKEACEDIVQNVFIDFWSKRKTVNIVSVKPYLFQSVKFQVFKHMRDAKISDEDLTRLNIVDVSVDILQKLEFEELEELIKDVVSSLPPRCQEIFVMSRFQNKSNQEIAIELKISMQAVKNQISKALKSLKQELHPHKIAALALLLEL